MLRHFSTTCQAFRGFTPELATRIRSSGRVGGIRPTNDRAWLTTTLSKQQQQGPKSKASPFRILYPIVGGLAVATGGVVLYVHDHVGGTEGLTRSISFYTLAIPTYIEYRWHMWRDSPDHVWDELDRNTSANGLEKIKELQGFYTKCGQICAANIGNAFPKIWQDTMSVLQDQVPPQDFDTIDRIVKSELDFDKVFATFEKEPIGSAAIGQVHRATLHDGTPVVVKVRYPDVERLLRGDVRTIKMFAQVAQPVHVPALEEIENQFMTEFDYVQEAQQLEQVRVNLTNAGLQGPGKLCRVPKPYLQYCTEQVLVMEELKGDKLAVGLAEEMKLHAARAGKTVQEYKEQLKQEELKDKEQGKPKKDPTASDYDTYISLLDKKRKADNLLKSLHNYTLAWLPGIPSKTLQDKSVLPLNHAKMIDDLIYIHGHEILVDGFFNGDPHPGNILLLREEDGSPALGLIDYGQVKRITKEQRVLFSKLMIALDDDDKDEVVKLMTDAGLRTQRMDPEVIYLYAKISYDQDNEELLGGKHVQMFMEDLEARDPIKELPTDFLMASRASIILRGLAHALRQSRSVARIWRPIAEQVVREES